LKVKSLSLRHFKKFYDYHLSLVNERTGKLRDFVVLYGGNGSGKSTILQSIGASLGVATGRLKRPDDLIWPGFEFPLTDHAWGFPSEVILDVSFAPGELSSTTEFFSKVPDFAQNPEAILPSDEPVVELIMENGKVSAPNRAQYFQFRGREYARKLVRQSPQGFDLFKQVGSIFWYHEYRNSSSLSVDDPEREVSFDENLLRRRLADWMFFHQRVVQGRYSLRPGQRDLYADLENAYKAVFPNRFFEGSMPRAGESMMDEPYFFLNDGENQYELSEMSSGERAIFPIIVDFATLNIHNSIILIDEIELHMTPELMTSFLSALPKLGQDNQFIMTTNSKAISEAIPKDALISLD
jgi:predicted ATPase